MTALDGFWERERIVPELGLYTYKIVRLVPTTRNILQASGIKIEIAPAATAALRRTKSTTTPLTCPFGRNAP